MSLVHITLALISGAIFGSLLVYFFMQRKWDDKRQQKDDELSNLHKQNLIAQKDLNQAQINQIRSEEQLLQLEDRLEFQKIEIQELHKKLTEQFELIANRVVDKNAQSLRLKHEEKLQDILSPFQDKIEKFEKKVEATHKESLLENRSLKDQIGQLQNLNKSIGLEAQNLTKALKGDQKTQGNWGEMILERILEKSGLEKGREYVVQESKTTADGKRYQPDVVIQLPENKTLIIDSKVSLTAYEKYVNTEKKELKEDFLKQHIASIRNHVKQLSEKNYPQLYQLDSLDFVLMFVPIEPAFNLALNHEQRLYTDSFDNNIIIISTSTLLATLRTISSIWRQEKQNRNAAEIAIEGGRMLDKFISFTQTMTQLGARLEMTQKDFDKAMNQLQTGNGNLVKRAEKMRDLGAKATKSFPKSFHNDSEE